MFFANLQINVEGITLTSKVNDVDIVVNPFVLAMIYSIHESGMQHCQTQKGMSIEDFHIHEELKSLLEGKKFFGSGLRHLISPQNLDF